MIQKHFGTTADGREVLAFTLGDERSHVTILNLGGTIQSLVVPDRDGDPTDVVLGYDDVKGYETNGGYLGALIGRFGNRIAHGRLVIDGKEYTLYRNDRGNHLHGGRIGFDKKIWSHSFDGETLVLTLFSPDGEEYYPGNLSVEVRYTFEGGALSIEYRATTDKKTAVNLTNHAYFNLSGAGSWTILDHILCMNSETIVPTDETMIPLGGFRSVKGSPFDFTSPKAIGDRIGEDDADLNYGDGYDHCFLINQKKRGAFEEYATVESPVTGIRMTCSTDQPSVQLYTGNGLAQEGKGGRYVRRSGFCLETQKIPNNVNMPAYSDLGSSILAPGEVYTHRSVYRFDIH